MKYEEDLRWKKLYKEKNYIEATRVLSDEIARNLLRVHNYYSDKKYTLDKLYKVYGGINFGRDSKEKVIKEMEDYIYLKCCLGDIGVLDLYFEGNIQAYKDAYDDDLKIRKELIKKMKKIKEV